MPELEYYMNDQDEAELVSYILSLSITLIPDLEYSKPRVRRIRSKRAYAALPER